MKQKLILCMMALSLSFSAAGTAIWKVEKGNNTVFIGGTVHVLSQSDYPLPLAFSQTYEQIDEVILETDIEAAKSAAFQAKVFEQMTYKGNGSIVDDVSSDTLEMLERYMQQRGLPFKQFKQFKASLLGVTIATIEIQLAGITTAGVDEYFYQKANGDNKLISYLESIDDQIRTIATMGKGQEDAFIRYSIQQAEETGSMVTELTKLWRNGDTDAANENYIKTLKIEFPDIYNSILTKRNRNWLPTIEAMFDDEDTEFVLVGFLHLVGDDSVLTMLQNKGYSITQLH